MLKITPENAPDLSEETLRLEIKTLKQRLAEKDEFIGVLKDYNKKFIEQAERLANIIEAQHQQETKERDDFLLKKAAKIIAAFEAQPNYEDETIEKIASTVFPTDSLGSFEPHSIPSTNTTNEINFYRNVDKADTSSKYGSDAKLHSIDHPFQKTIDLIKTSDQKLPDADEPAVGEKDILNESRGDELDESINNTLNINTPPLQQRSDDSRPSFLMKRKPS